MELHPSRKRMLRHVDPRLWLSLCVGVPALLVSSAALLARSFETVRERRRHRRTVENLGPPAKTAELVGVKPQAVVTLEGILVTDARVTSFHPYGPSFLDEPHVYALTHVPTGAELALDLDGRGRAVLEGDAQVVVGSTETGHDAPLEQAKELGAESLTAARIKNRSGQLRTVRGGDRVRVRGAIDPAPDDDALYRERSNVYRLTPAKPDAPGVPAAIPIASVTTVTQKRRVSPRAAVLLVSAALAMSAAAILIGPPRSSVAPATIANGSASAPEPPLCRKEVQALAERADPKASEASAACGDALARAFVSFGRGSFAEASRAFKEAIATDPTLTPSLSEAEAHLFAHDYAAATATVERMVKVFYPGPSTAEKRDLECIADVLTRRTQSDGGIYFDRPDVRRICNQRPLLKLLRSLDSGGAYDGYSEDPARPENEWKEWINDVWTLEAAMDPVDGPRTAAFGAHARLLARPIALEKRVLDRSGIAATADHPPLDRAAIDRDHGKNLQTFAALASELVLFEVVSGFPERAAPYWPILDILATEEKAGRPFTRTGATWPPERRAADEQNEHYLREYTLSVAAAAAALAGEHDRAKRYGALGEPHSAHCAVQLDRMLMPGAAWENPDEDGHWPGRIEIFAAAEAGDGAQIAKELARQKDSGGEVLARVLPHVRTNRDALERWFASNDYPPACITCGASTLQATLAARREVARLLGVNAEHDRLTPTVTRFTDALTDPAIAYELDELETFFHRKNWKL